MSEEQGFTGEVKGAMWKRRYIAVGGPDPGTCGHWLGPHQDSERDNFRRLGSHGQIKVKLYKLTMNYT